MVLVLGLYRGLKIIVNQEQRQKASVEDPGARLP